MTMKKTFDPRKKSPPRPAVRVSDRTASLIGLRSRDGSQRDGLLRDPQGLGALGQVATAGLFEHVNGIALRAAATIADEEVAFAPRDGPEIEALRRRKQRAALLRRAQRIAGVGIERDDRRGIGDRG